MDLRHEIQVVSVCEVQCIHVYSKKTMKITMENGIFNKSVIFFVRVCDCLFLLKRA